MGGFRAKDADRERYVDVIETAYVDGQLGDQDRELRVSRALVAETLDELEALTRDLQNRPAPVVVATPAPAPAPARPSRPSVSADASSTNKVVGTVAALALGIVFLGAVSSMHSAQEDWAGGTDYAEEVPWGQIDAEQAERGFSMTNRGVRDLVVAYEAEFGTLEAVEVVFRPRSVTVQVPLGGPRSRVERWTWDGAWRKDSDATDVVPRQRIDLGSIDVGALVDNVATARRALGVERGRFTHAVLAKPGEAPAELTIHVENEFHETGYLSTTPDGKILRRQRYRA
jgi:hypothetical protein